MITINSCILILHFLIHYSSNVWHACAHRCKYGAYSTQWEMLSWYIRPKKKKKVLNLDFYINIYEGGHFEHVRIFWVFCLMWLRNVMNVSLYLANLLLRIFLNVCWWETTHWLLQVKEQDKPAEYLNTCQNIIVNKNIKITAGPIQ